MASRTNADNVQRFRADLARFQPILRNRVNLLLRRVATVVAREIIIGGTYGPGTPLDTGFARAMWFATLGGAGGGPAIAKPTGRKLGHGALGDGHGALAMALAVFDGITSGGPTIYLLNNAVYIRSLEYGHSAQAPVGMVRVVMSAIQGIVSDAVREIAAGGGAEA